MPEHVFVETNWVVDFAAPAHNRVPAALNLVVRAERGEIVLHVPAVCLREAENVIRQKFQPKEAKALREFRRWALERGEIGAASSEAAVGFLDAYTAAVQRDLRSLDSLLEGIRARPGIDVFGLTEEMLVRAISLRQEVAVFLKPFDEAILAAVLERARVLRGEGVEQFSFCELDSDLRPLDRRGNARPDLKAIFDEARVWVYGDYDLRSPTPPPDWPPAAVDLPAAADPPATAPEAPGTASAEP